MEIVMKKTYVLIPQMKNKYIFHKLLYGLGYVF